MSAVSRFRAAATVVVVALALSGCASTAALTDTAASQLQQDVLAVTTAAKDGDVTGALAALDEASAELEAAYARGDVTEERHALITAAIAAVRAKLEGTPQDTSDATGTTTPATTNPKPGSSTGTDPVEEPEAPIMTPAPGTNDTTAPKPSATPTPSATPSPTDTTPAPVSTDPTETPADGGDEDGSDGGDDEDTGEDEGDESTEAPTEPPPPVAPEVAPQSDE